VSALQFRVLGPLEVLRDGRPVKLGGPKQRAALALLLLDANHVVSTDALIDGLWGEQPPDTAGAALQVHVAKIRQTLAPDAPITTRAPGYVIGVHPDALDLSRFDALVVRARSAPPSEASALLQRALELWRGPALSDLSHEPFVPGVAARLAEERLAALERRIDADLARGVHSELVGELRELAAAHPLREQLWCQLMLALYRSGRQADALAAFQDARRVLGDELGLDPGAELRAIENAVLQHDPNLDWRPIEGNPSDSARGVHTTIVGDEHEVSRAFIVVAGVPRLLGHRTTIGRRSANTIVIDDERASREHAVIQADDHAFVLRDLHSTNGVYVNGERVIEHTLVDGDRISVADTELVFRTDS
jgi:DNA-binding SARP family transcriptional activator